VLLTQDSHLHRNQTKTLTTKSKILGNEMTIYDGGSSFSTAEGWAFKQELNSF